MHRAALVLLIAAVAALLLAAGAVAWTLWTLPRHALVADAERQLAEVGLSVVAEGTPELALWPLPGVRLGPLRPGPGEAPARLAARTAVIGVAPAGILTGPAAGRIRLSGATLELHDPRLPGAVVLEDAELTLAPHGAALSLSGEADIAGRRVAVAAEIADIAALAAGAGSAVALDLSTDGERLRFSGTASIDTSRALPAFAGTLAVESADPLAAARWLAAATGSEPASLPACQSGRLLSPEAEPDGETCPPAIGALTVEATVDAAPDHLLARGRGSIAASDRTVGVDATLRGGRGWAEAGTATAELAVRVGGVLSAYWYPEAVIAGGVWTAAGPIDAAVLDMATLRAWTGQPFAGWPETGATSLSGQLAVADWRATLSEGAERPHDTKLRAVVLDFDAGGAPGSRSDDKPAGPGEDGPGEDGPRSPRPEGRRSDQAARPSGDAGASASGFAEEGDPEAAPTAPTGTASDRTGPGADAAVSAGPAASTGTVPTAASSAELSPAEARPAGADAGAPASVPPGAPGAAAASDRPAIEDQRGEPLPPGTPPPPGLLRRDPLTAPAPAPRAGQALAPQVAEP